MAIVMALGIITQGVLLNFFGFRFFNGILGEVLCIINLGLWSSFIVSFFLTLIDKKFIEIHFSNPLNRFGIGTWVASTSICGILIYKQFNGNILAQVISYFNLLLWFLYIIISIYTYLEIHTKKHLKKVNGILLLTTVSTQSIVLLLNTVHSEVPDFLNNILVISGLCFYLISFIFILKRYKSIDSWSIEIDWNNTNCILHGALSITGLASFMSHALSVPTMRFIWICAAIMFITIELIEIYRLVKRVQYFGLRRGVLIYDVSQWSRIFTFAMFYTFTYLMNFKSPYVKAIQDVIIQTGVWTILFLVLIETFLCISYIRNTFKKEPHNTVETNLYI